MDTVSSRHICYLDIWITQQRLDLSNLFLAQLELLAI